MGSLGFLTMLLAATGAVAQNNSIPWVTDPTAAIAQARASRRPLMAYVLASERYRDDQVDRQQKRSFRDPRIMKKARNFVPLRLSRSQQRDKLTQFGFGEHSDMEISFLTPDGEVLGTLSATGIAEVDSLSLKMSLVLVAWGNKIFESEVKPTLADENAKPNDLKQAVQLVSDFSITGADKNIIALLDRPRLDPSVRKAVFDTLPQLSTKESVAKLLELARAGDALATKALGQCTPVAAEAMLKELKADAVPFDYVVYKAVTQICKVPKPKPEKFFENSNQKLIDDELKRVTDAVAVAAQKWKAENE